MRKFWGKKKMMVAVPPWQFAILKGEKKKRAKPRKLEEPIHILCFNWLDSNVEGMVYHCPNGADMGSEVIFIKGKPVPRAAIMWKKLLAIGARPGVLDLIIHWFDPVLKVGRTAYFEVKSAEGTLTDNEKLFIKDLDRVGIEHLVIRCLADAIDACDNLGIPLKSFPVPSRATRV